MTARTSGSAWPTSRRLQACRIVPTTGGPLEPFLQTAVMAVWSPDGSRIAYHETTPGIRSTSPDATVSNARRIFVARSRRSLPPPELVARRPLSLFLAGVRRTTWTSGASHRMAVGRAHHHAQLDGGVPRSARRPHAALHGDGGGRHRPLAVVHGREDRVPARVNMAVEHYISICGWRRARGQPGGWWRRCRTRACELWTVPIADGVAGEAAASRMTLQRRARPRPASAPTARCGTWRRAAERRRVATCRRTTHRAVEGNPGRGGRAVAVSPDGESVCFPVRRRGRSTLYCATAEGTGARAVAESLDVKRRGLVVAGWQMDRDRRQDGEGSRLFKIPIDGGPPVRLVDSVSSNPVWSPNGKFILYSGDTAGAERSGQGGDARRTAVSVWHRSRSIASATATDFFPAGQGSW